MNVIILTLPASVLVQKTHIAPVVRRPTTGVVVGLRIPTVDHHALLRQGLGERFGMRRCAVLFRPFSSDSLARLLLILRPFLLLGKALPARSCSVRNLRRRSERNPNSAKTTRRRYH